MRNSLVGLVLIVGVVASCGKSPSTPSDNTPPATVTGLTINLRDVVLVGVTATATATATMSDGSTQTITTGFRSDTPTAATATAAGVVTGVANGDATIVAAFGGREATKRIRVAPNYGGRWDGMQTVTACAATGDFVGICEVDGGVVGDLFPIGLTARQTDLTISGEFSIEGSPFPTFNTQIDSSGSIRFASVAGFGEIMADASWQMTSTENGRATGTIREKYSAPGSLVGDVTFDSTLTGFTRTSADAAPSARSGGPNAAGLLRKWKRER